VQPNKASKEEIDPVGVPKFDSLYNYVFRQNALPPWIIYLNLGSLVGILAWPLVFFGSIFLADNPKEGDSTFLHIVLIDCYPLLLILVTYVSYKLFRVNRIVSAILPIIPILFYLFALIKIIP
jgi:hypothetical protein